MGVSPFLTAEWRFLAMFNYEIDPEVLKPYVPRGTTLDTFNGRHFVSEVGFLFLDMRVAGVALPFHRRFEEVNLRFYVRRDCPDGSRRGVVFIREIVPRALIALGAKLLYNEPYRSHRMRSDVEWEATGPGQPGRACYAWKAAGGEHSIDVRFGGTPAPPAPGSEEQFISEHFWGYTMQRDGGTVEYRVSHPPWRIWNADRAELRIDVERVYGKQFAGPLSATPSSVFVADGSEVGVFRGQRIV